MKNKIYIPEVHQAVCTYFGVDYMFPFQRHRTLEHIYIRQVFQYLCRNISHEGSQNLKKIGHYLSDISKPFNHSTVINNCKRIEGYLCYDKKVINDIKKIKEILNC